MRFTLVVWSLRGALADDIKRSSSPPSAGRRHKTIVCPTETSEPEADIPGEHEPAVSHAIRSVDQEQLWRGSQPEAASRVQCDGRFRLEIAAPSVVRESIARWGCIPAAVSLIYAAGARGKLEPVMPQGKDESNTERYPGETVMDIEVSIFTVYQSSRVDGREHAPFKRQPAAEAEAVCATQGHSAESGRPIWNGSLPSVPAVEGDLIPLKGLALCEKWK